MNTFVLVAFLFSVTFTTAHSLSCLPCDMQRCTPKYKLKCKGGLVNDVCGCCKTCAKIIGEECGGVFGIYGTCDDGLECITYDPETGLSSLDQKGICVPKMTYG